MDDQVRYIYGEQDGMLIHIEFNKLKITYCRM